MMIHTITYIGLGSIILAFLLHLTYKTGLEKGLEIGEEKGHGEGYDKGLIEGRDKGREERYEQGYDKGFLDGRDKGRQEVFVANDEESAPVVRAALEKEREGKIKLAYGEGKLKGEQETLAKFKVSVEPFYEVNDISWFAKERIAGYRISYFFDKFPIGEPLTRIRSRKRESDKKMLLETLSYTSHLVGLVSGRGMVGTLVPNILFSIAARYIKSLNKGRVSSGIRNEFENNGIELYQDSSVSVEEPDSKWNITSGDNNYIVEKAVNELNVYLSA